MQFFKDHKNAVTLIAMLSSAWPFGLHAQTQHVKNVWFMQASYADFGKNKQWFSQAEVHVRVNTADDLFRQNLDSIRIGRRLGSSFSYVVAFEYLPTQLPTRFVNEQRVWQQIGFQYRFSDQRTLLLYNRFENRWVLEAAGISLRQRLKAVIKQCDVKIGICPYIATETFVNYNPVSWDPSKTISQIRNSAGIEKAFSQTVKIRVAYLNQFLRFRDNQNVSFDILDLQAAFIF